MNEEFERICALLRKLNYANKDAIEACAHHKSMDGYDPHQMPIVNGKFLAVSLFHAECALEKWIADGLPAYSEGLKNDQA